MDFDDHKPLTKEIYYDIPSTEDVRLIGKVQGVDDGYRLRVGDLRVLFSMEDNKIYIDNIIPRSQTYMRL